MNKKLSIVFALAAIAVLMAFSFSAYAAEEHTDSDVPGISEENPIEEPVLITSKNTEITLSTTTYTYNGAEKKPTPTVFYVDEEGNQIKLVKGKDYDCTYSKNINVGKATVKLVFKGDYSGTLSQNYTIKAKSISGSAFSAKLSYTKTIYSGNAKQPSVTVYWNNNGKKVKLVKNTDYTVKYSNNKNIGNATVTITGKKNFSGSIKKTFKISPKTTTGFKVKSKTPNSVTFTWKKTTNVTGYQIVKYDSKQKKYVSVIKLAANVTSYTVNKLTSASAYQFNIRAYKTLSDKKTNYYGAYCGEITVVLKPEKVALSYVYKSGKNVKVEWKKTRGTGYELQYTTDKSFKKSVKTVKISGSSKTAYTIKNVNNNKTYYVRVRAYYTRNKKTYNGSYSSSLSTYYSNLFATFSSYYDTSNVKRTTNLQIASKAISGTIIKPGETFSFNKVVGPRTVAKGYKEASVFAGNGTGIGGGICQVASTIFNCALRANVGIVERHQHSERVHYVPNGMDAAIYGSYQDFKWKNTTKYPIRIMMSVKNGVISCSFYTCVKAAPPKVTLKVTQSGNVFTLKRYVSNKVNYTTKSKY
ncbi:MAG: VanW family protein [Eubacterium sp.]|nr:VanW family protein [Eubacterium sp.]